MTIQLDPPVEARLREAAAARGMGADTYASRLIAEHLPPAEVELPAGEPQSLDELFAEWAAEDYTDDPSEIAKREAEWAEFKRQMNRNRLESEGPNARTPFPCSEPSS